jgi:hypothetical protein
MQTLARVWTLAKVCISPRTLRTEWDQKMAMSVLVIFYQKPQCGANTCQVGKACRRKGRA